MMNDVTGKSATDHFRRARKRATLEDVVAHLTGKPAELDGHHRVSVARQRGISHIHAYVTEICTRVPLDAAILDHFEASPETLWKRRSCYTGLTVTTVPISEGVRL